MTKLTFKNKDIVRCVEHACKASDHSRGFGDTSPPRPSLILVKDDGIYIMSNGKPNDIVDWGDGDRSFVAYAKGYEADRAGVWDLCRNAVGGDDFAEYIPLDTALCTDILEGSDLIIKITSSSLSVLTEKTRSTDEDKAWLEGLMEDRWAFYPNGRHKRLKALPLDRCCERTLRAKYPTAVILNSMPIDEAVKTYQQRS
jgi:hypothetical protein